jgi:hypothetical protein
MTLMCPSAQPDMEDCRVLGVVTGEPQAPRTAYLTQILPATSDILAMAGSAPVGEVFRLAARCEESKCTHFDGRDCKLVTRIVNILPAVVDTLPVCMIRAECRWFAQEGRPACFRCPQVITRVENPTDQVALAASPA